MQDDDKKHADQFDAALPLPINDRPKKTADEPAQKKDDAAANKQQPEAEPTNPAADIIRKRVEAAYASEPDAKEEAAEAQEDKQQGQKLSKHQQFILELTSSGRPLHEIQMAWHEYYAGLPDQDKHAVWQEFYKTQSAGSHYHAAMQSIPEPEETAADSTTKPQAKPRTKKPSLPRQLTTPATADLRKQLKTLRGSFRTTDLGDGVKIMPEPNLLHSLIFGLGIGGMVLIIFLFSFFNERFIAPFIQPSRNVSGTPIITSAGSISQNPEIIIPKINVEIPVVYTVNTIDDNAVETALESGVVHYADTALPGQNGNVVIVGHSSNNIFNPGRYKFAFVLLSRLDNGDTFYLDKDGHRYTYEVYKKQIVSPTDVSVLGPADKPATASLITCDPPGTSNNRLVVTGEQIDPSPSANLAQKSTKLAEQSAIIPGNSPTLWSRFVKWFWN